VDKHIMLVRMLRQLLEDMAGIQQMGAGYYSCLPVIRRYNKLLDQAKVLLPNDTMVETFEPFQEQDPKDPGDKMTVMQGIKVEIGQLISLVELSREEQA